MCDSDMHELARDRDLHSPELHKPNDYYGHASCIKRFVGMEEKFPLHAVVVHGPMFPTLHWSLDLDAPLPVLLTSSGAAGKVLRDRTSKLVFAIGPVLAYASCHLSETELAEEKKRLGRNLLVFPSHSTHHIDALYDARAMCAEIEHMGKVYDSVSVCLYWKDILRGMDAPFRAAGFDCRTAGHMYDNRFLDRLRTMFTLSDGVVCYSWTSAIGYAVGMNKPTLVRHAPAERFVADEDVLRRDTLGCDNDVESVRYRQRVFALFSEMREPTEEQREAIDYMWGLSQVRTSADLLCMLELAHDMHETKVALRLGDFPDALGMARVYARMGLVDKACLVLDQELQMGRRNGNSLAFAARLHLDKRNIPMALEYIRILMRDYPEMRPRCAVLLQESARLRG